MTEPERKALKGREAAVWDAAYGSAMALLLVLRFESIKPVPLDMRLPRDEERAAAAADEAVKRRRSQANRD